MYFYVANLHVYRKIYYYVLFFDMRGGKCVQNVNTRYLLQQMYY